MAHFTMQGTSFQSYNQQDGAMANNQPRTSFSPMTLIATPETTDLCWYPDSGSTNHITSNVENLMQKSPYTGQEQVLIDNGKSLKIFHVGNITFSSSF